MTIGDVLAVVGVILGICLSLWVTLIGAALLFEEKTRLARRVWETQSGGALGIGLALLLPLGVGGIALLSAPGGLKLVGWIFLLTLFAISLLGGAGLAQLLGERTGARDENISSLTALARGAGMMALAWLFPVLGWFLVAPICLIMGLGAGAKVLWKPGEKKPAPLSPILLAGDESCESPGAIV